MIDLLQSELAAAGVAIDPARRRAVTAAIAQRGRDEFDLLCREAGLPLECIQRSAVASLGRGAAITEFAAAPIAIPADCVSAIAGLGGLAALIVSGFDAILDSGAAPPEIILRPGTQPAAGSPKRRIFSRLIEIYYERLDALPHRNGAVRTIVDTAIRRMYDAELQSAGQRDIGRSVWWRKNALPFVVMAAPGWLAASDWRPAAFRGHLQWLGRLGEFLGWIDDCADLDRDRSTGQPNRVRVLLDSSSSRILARRIAEQGARVLNEWLPVHHPAALRDVFNVTVWNWIDSRENLRTA